jgi:ATP-dependent DNA ligase
MIKSRASAIAVVSTALAHPSIENIDDDHMGVLNRNFLHTIGRGQELYAAVCERSVEGIVSKRVDAPYTPGNRGLWLKTKCLNREEFVVVGWTDLAGSRPFLGALLLAY